MLQLAIHLSLGVVGVTVETHNNTAIKGLKLTILCKMLLPHRLFKSFKSYTAEF